MPTFIASVYGMNFEHMPELDWPMGYLPALAVMGLRLLPRSFQRTTGSKLGPAATLTGMPVAHVGSGTFEPLQLLPLAVAGVAYALRARSLSSEGRPAPAWRQVRCFARAWR